MHIKHENIELNSKKERNKVLTHWLTQKVSALILIPLLCWFLYIFKDFINLNYNSKIIWMQNISNSLLLAHTGAETVYGNPCACSGKGCSYGLEGLCYEGP